MRVNGRRIPLFVTVGLLLAAIVLSSIPMPHAYAAQITNRKVTLLAGATDGGSKPGGVVKHQFDFTLPGGSNVGSIRFEYCTIASGTCTMPTGLVTTSATLDNQTGATGFTMVNTTNGSPYITRTAANIGANTTVSYRFDLVTNPTGVNEMFFIRIATFASTDTTGSAIDTGTVAASTARQIELTGIMPESLIFCTAETITTTSGIPDCASATDGSVSFNQLFSPSDTATATSQLAASTNATFGYAITVTGTTMTSGSNTIAAMNTLDTSKRGVGQFGMNLVANATPVVGTAITPASNGTTYKANPTTDYGTVDSFKFTSGDTIANSNNGGAGPTDSQIYTASYIVNVSGSQLAGTYTTTLTYTCTATY